MAEKVTKEEREFSVTHHDGTISKVKGTITTTHHGTKDEHGHPKISVHIGASPIGSEAPAPVHLLNEDKG